MSKLLSFQAHKGVLSCYIGITECINREINVLGILEFTELC